MSLPCSGPLSINDIRGALGTSDGNLRNLSATAGFSTPDAISEFYCYNPSPPPGSCYVYQGIDYGWAEGAWCDGTYFNIYVNPWDGYCVQWMSGSSYWTGSYCSV